MLTEQQPARERTEDGLEAHDDSCLPRLRVLLPQDLQREGHTGRHDAAVEDSKPSIEYRLHGDRLEAERRDEAACRTDADLRDRELNRVDKAREAVDEEDVCRPEQS